jgi:hypothetical protein
MRFRIALGVALIAVAVLALPAYAADEAMEMEKEMPFGGDADVEFAKALWVAMDGYSDWRVASDYYASNAPHGQFVKIYYSVVTIDENPYHVVVKDNFAGEGATLETVAESPADHVSWITVMVQREAGYDPDNDDWFWVNYGPDGMVRKTDTGMAMAGRVAKGMSMGCIACHANARGADYYFTND